MMVLRQQTPLRLASGGNAKSFQSPIHVLNWRNLPLVSIVGAETELFQFVLSLTLQSAVPNPKYFLG